MGNISISPGATAPDMTVPLRPVTCDARAAAGAEVFRPCFVVGCERSGTTLLAVMLSRHSQIAMTPETHFFTMMPRRGRHRPQTHESLLKRALADRRVADLKLDPRRLAVRLAEYPPTYASLLRALLEEYAATENKPRPGEKTPLHLMNVPQILEWFPEARIVGIVRDGRDVVLSLMDMPWKEDRRLRWLCLLWMRLLRLAEDFCRRFPRQFMLVRYEELVASPADVLHRVDEFLGITFEPGQLDTGVDSRVVPLWEAPWKGDAMLPPDPSRIGARRRKATPHQMLVMHSLMGEGLRRMGYEDTELPRASLPTRASNMLLNWMYRSGLSSLWRDTVGKHLPAARRRRHQARTAAQTAVTSPAFESPSGAS